MLLPESTTVTIDFLKISKMKSWQIEVAVGITVQPTFSKFHKVLPARVAINSREKTETENLKI